MSPSWSHPEQKADAARLVRQIGNLSQATRDLDLNPNVLRASVRRPEIDAAQGPPGALATSGRAELARLRREHRPGQMERDFQDNAAALFVKDPGRVSK